MKNLRSNLTMKDMEDVFEAYRKFGELEKTSIFLNRVFKANLSVLEEVLTMFDIEVRDVMYKHSEKDGTVDRIRMEGEKEGKKEGKKEAALKMIRKGFSPDEVSDILEMPVEWVQGLVQ